MTFLSIPYISLGLGFLLVGALWALKSANPRFAAIFAASTSFMSFLLATLEVTKAGHTRLFDPWLSFFRGGCSRRRADGFLRDPHSFRHHPRAEA